VQAGIPVGHCLTPFAVKSSREDSESGRDNPMCKEPVF
jgi:hypothetical protein